MAEALAAGITLGKQPRTSTFLNSRWLPLPRAQNSFIRWLLTRRNIHTITCLSTLAFYAHAHTHTHTHTRNLFLGSHRGHTSRTLTQVASHIVAQSQTHGAGLRADLGGFSGLSHFLHLPAGMRSGTRSQALPLHPQAGSRNPNPVHTHRPAFRPHPGPPYPRQLGTLGESKSHAGGPMAVCKARGVVAFCSTALDFHVLKKFTSETAEENETLGQERPSCSEDALRSRGKELSPAEPPL